MYVIKGTASGNRNMIYNLNNLFRNNIVISIGNCDYRDFFNTNPYVYSAYFSDYTIGNIGNLIEFIENINHEMLWSNARHEYLIIYDDAHTEDDLRDLIQWIADNKCGMQCNHVLLMCKHDIMTSEQIEWEEIKQILE